MTHWRTLGLKVGAATLFALALAACKNNPSGHDGLNAPGTGAGNSATGGAGGSATSPGAGTGATPGTSGGTAAQGSPAATSDSTGNTAQPPR
ncbi:hypothetical protein [Massilia sp. CF038]|uniref:hypothetical protein n=1 Tax=Massilia sp. CF038 TaxID=1881045 RepID=UPI00091742C5|nr:hypothetical protein [Massilia sp. CF038]SHG42152.1 hypothetical protein SAMN05428948_0401 [Massilia sp. CF038]